MTGKTQPAATASVNYNKPVIHFAHANGFPAASYQTLFRYFSDDVLLIAVEKFGHDERFPVVNNWQNQADELLAEINAEAPDEQVYLVGHSFGAVISHMAACIRPDKVKGLIMLDPPLVTGWAARFFRFAKHTRLIDSLTPAGKAKIRRTRWSTDVNLHDYFSSRGLFKNMDPRCVSDYVNAVTTLHNGHIDLTFDADVEATLFRTVPHNLHRYAGKLACPAVLVTGDKTEVCVPKWRNPFIRANNLQHETLPGGHMFPLEHPEQVAAFVESIVVKWEGQ